MPTVSTRDCGSPTAAVSKTRSRIGEKSTGFQQYLYEDEAAG